MSSDLSDVTCQHRQETSIYEAHGKTKYQLALFGLAYFWQGEIRERPI